MSEPWPSPRWIDAADEIECGILHSGIPACCVAFFVIEWASVYGTDLGKQYQVRIDNLGHPGYIPCPRCLARQLTHGDAFVRVRPCVCSLRHELHAAEMKGLL